MKTSPRGIAFALAGAALFTGYSLYAAGAPSSRSASEAARIAHGRYLVNQVSMCGDCHTPMTEKGPDMSRYLQGADLEFAPKHPIPNWASHAPNITGAALQREFTVTSLSTLLKGKVDKQGRPVPVLDPPMPAFRMNDADALAVATYLMSLKPKTAAR